MKIAAIVLLAFLSSCSKDVSKSEQIAESKFVGTYISTNPIALDTSYVSVITGNVIMIKWVAKSGNSIIFDSVIVAPNLSFTDNEFIENGVGTHRSVGSGYFLPRVMKFTFQLGSSAKIIFDGVKQ